MEANTHDTIQFLIRRYRLHDRIPVRLDELLDRFTVRRYDFSPVTLGFAVVRPREIHIGINQNLSPAWQRLAEGHEVGHIIGYHPHRLYTCQANEWFREEHEHEAQLGAALLLVPMSAVHIYYDEFTPKQLAELLQVPVGLVDLRWSYALVNGEV
jgi:Zn-dependent peptidase ImmA (M78 family)